MDGPFLKLKFQKHFQSGCFSTECRVAHRLFLGWKRCTMCACRLSNEYERKFGTLPAMLVYQERTPWHTALIRRPTGWGMDGPFLKLKFQKQFHSGCFGTECRVAHRLFLRWKRCIMCTCLLSNEYERKFGSLPATLAHQERAPRHTALIRNPTGWGMDGPFLKLKLQKQFQSRGDITVGCRRRGIALQNGRVLLILCLSRAALALLTP